MPDDNKFEKLREIGYSIPITCGLCCHGVFGSAPRGPWGTCALHHYFHQKHDNPAGGRGVSVLASGSCTDAELSPDIHLGAHAEFLTKQ